MQITYYGHSCFSVVAGGKTLLFDPFISENELAKHINLNEIKADYIFVSHGHVDHMLDVAAIANRTGALVVGGWELYEYFGKQGLKNLHPLNPGGTVTFDFGTVKAVAAQHSSSFPDGTYAGIASGFVFKTADGNFYYSGDAALALEMTLIPKWADLNFAVLPIGDVLTMGVEEAIEAAQFVKAGQILGVHYDTFEFIKIEKPEAIRKFAESGLKLHLPKIGESLQL